MKKLLLIIVLIFTIFINQSCEDVESECEILAVQSQELAEADWDIVEAKWQEHKYDEFGYTYNYVIPSIFNIAKAQINGSLKTAVETCTLYKTTSLVDQVKRLKGPDEL